MPELPEVETLRRGLEETLTGQRILQVSIARPKVLKGQNEAEFRDRIVGKRLVRADRRGKYLLLPLSAVASQAPFATLLIHLNMRGSLRLADPGEPEAPHQCIAWTLEGGRELRYHDVWRWGTVQAIEGEGPALGPEPLEPGWDGDALLKGIGARRSPIKTALLDQSVVAGIGNIYADEALFEAGIAPGRSAASLSAGEAQKLVGAVRAVLSEAVALGGSRGDYVDLSGKMGRFVPRIYDRGGHECPRCGQVLKKLRLGGRGTTFCPDCQK